jgi:hypothetical protein
LAFLRGLRGFILPWLPASAAQGVAQDELDLRVEAAQIVVRPPLYRIQNGAVDPQEKGFPLGHGLLVNRAGVHDRLRRLLAAQHDQEIADHLRLSLFVECDDALVRQHL